MLCCYWDGGGGVSLSLGWRLLLSFCLILQVQRIQVWTTLPGNFVLFERQVNQLTEAPHHTGGSNSGAHTCYLSASELHSPPSPRTLLEPLYTVCSANIATIWGAHFYNVMWNISSSFRKLELSPKSFQELFLYPDSAPTLFLQLAIFNSVHLDPHILSPPKLQ